MSEPTSTPEPSTSSGTGPFQGRLLTASLTVSDLGASLAWYRDVLGFVVDREHERDGVLRAISLRAGDVRMLITQDDGARGDGRTRGEAMSLMITTGQDIDELARQIRERGGTLDSGPVSAPSGMRAFRLRDPDGFRFVISSGW